MEEIIRLNGLTITEEINNLNTDLDVENSHQNDHDFENYNPYNIPPDWEIANNHGIARRVSILKQNNNINLKGKLKICPCCGFKIDREDLTICSNPMKLDYLGAGYPLFYNWLKCCIFLLFLLFIGTFYDLLTNYYGNDCIDANDKGNNPNACIKNFVTIFTLANKKNSRYNHRNQIYINVALYVFCMITLMIFRKIQRKVNATIDQNQLTPSDYTIIVKNIPIGIENFDYIEEIKKIIENSAVKDDSIKVMKINLVYDISEIIKIDKKIEFNLTKKKDILKKNGFDYDHKIIRLLNKEFDNLKKDKKQTCEDMILNYKKFVGIALVSLETEQRFYKKIIENFYF